MGKDEVDAMCDLLLEEDLQVCYVMAGTNGMTLPKFINHPLSMIGSDGVLLGEYPSPRTYGTFSHGFGKVCEGRGGNVSAGRGAKDDVLPGPAVGDT